MTCALGWKTFINGIRRWNGARGDDGRNPNWTINVIIRPQLGSTHNTHPWERNDECYLVRMKQKQLPHARRCKSSIVPRHEHKIAPDASFYKQERPFFLLVGSITVHRCVVLLCYFFSTWSTRLFMVGGVQGIYVLHARHMGRSLFLIKP